ncbi:uncharacterized protein TNCV_1048331 [Trichonephila clavipes]|nr:uncharacterized protein TNCV_1048331 [Trichonephila clavipes]
MVMALDGLTRLCPLILFDWRLYAERGCPRFFHTHSDAKRTDDCELGFLKQIYCSSSLSVKMILLQLSLLYRETTKRRPNASRGAENLK